MSRTRGNINFASDFEVRSQSPLDARIVVNTKAELTDTNTWGNSGASYYIYRGMLVSVKDENKVYMYIADEVSADKIRLSSSWKEIGANGQSGTTDYNQLNNKPAINGNILDSNFKLKTINNKSLIGLGNIVINEAIAPKNIGEMDNDIPSYLDGLSVGLYYGHVENGQSMNFGQTTATGANCIIKGGTNIGYVYIEVLSLNGKDIKDIDSILIQKIHVDNGTTIIRKLNKKVNSIYETISDTLADFKKALEGGGGGGETTEDYILLEDGTTAILLEDSGGLEPWSASTNDNNVGVDFKYMLLEKSKIN